MPWPSNTSQGFWFHTFRNPRTRLQNCNSDSFPINGSSFESVKVTSSFYKAIKLCFQHSYQPLWSVEVPPACPQPLRGRCTVVGGTHCRILMQVSLCFAACRSPTVVMILAVSIFSVSIGVSREFCAVFLLRYYFCERLLLFFLWYINNTNCPWNYLPFSNWWKEK